MERHPIKVGDIIEGRTVTALSSTGKTATMQAADGTITNQVSVSDLQTKKDQAQDAEADHKGTGQADAGQQGQTGQGQTGTVKPVKVGDVFNGRKVKTVAPDGKSATVEDADGSVHEGVLVSDLTGNQDAGPKGPGHKGPKPGDPPPPPTPTAQQREDALKAPPPPPNPPPVRRDGVKGLPQDEDRHNQAQDMTLVQEYNGNKDQVAINGLLEACDKYGIHPGQDQRPKELLSWKWEPGNRIDGTPPAVSLVTAGGTKIKHFLQPGVTDEETEERLRTIFAVVAGGGLPADLTLPDAAVTGLVTQTRHRFQSGYLRREPPPPPTR